MCIDNGCEFYLPAIDLLFHRRCNSTTKTMLAIVQWRNEPTFSEILHILRWVCRVNDHRIVGPFIAYHVGIIV